MLGSFAIPNSGCNKDVKVNLDVPGAAGYSNLYMPQAVNNPIELGISITAADYKVPYGAHLGGSLNAGEDIGVTFEVAPSLVATFNQKNKTSYKLMPEGSYSLETPSAVITKGTQSTGALNLVIKTKGFMAPFITYLLPVKLTGSGKTKINDELNTTYFLFTGAYAPGEVPREKVISMGANAGDFIIDFIDGNFIRKDPANGDLLLYKADQATGLFTTPPKTISTGWNVMNKIIFFGGNRLIARWKDNGGNINQYYINAEGNFGDQREVGQGWGVLLDVVPFKGLLLGVYPDGGLTQFPLNGSGDFNYGDIRQIGTGWGGLKQIFPYQNSLIIIENNGDLSQLPLSDGGVFGAKKKVGTGWDMYKKVITSGTDLLALDSNGDLWRYKFNPQGLWPLK